MCPVSIPFIAGQWSLLRVAGVYQLAYQVRFNPLHCGAVVASVSSPDPVCHLSRFQSPSLRGSGRFQGTGFTHRHSRQLFQSPSLRGSGRFSITPTTLGSLVVLFQSPSLRGSGRFPSVSCWLGWTVLCFNPLHCGAVVASGRDPFYWALDWFLFQSPSLRGSGRFNPRGPSVSRTNSRVSIPFIAGQWSLRSAHRRRPDVLFLFQSPSLRGSGRFATPWRMNPTSKACLNPLHCGDRKSTRLNSSHRS